MEMSEWKAGTDYPEWMDDAALKTLSRGYLLKGETPFDMFKRVAASAAKHLQMPYLESKFFDYMWKGWLCLATPVAANMGTDRGLPISCFGGTVGDSILRISESNREIMIMSKFGGGTSLNYSNIRPRGSKIAVGGISEGVVPWCKINDSTIIAVSQGSTRRGALAVYLRDDHPDFDDFLRIRDAKGDVNKQCLNLNLGVSLGDGFMERVKNGDPIARNQWIHICQNRMESGGRGQPYLIFRDNINRQNPDMYKHLGLDVPSSNLCTEITLFSDEDHSFVCCLSSLNLSHWDAWKDTDLVETAIYFLDAVMEEFIIKARKIVGLEKAVRFAEKSRALGLGVLGWHTLLQKKQLPFDTSWEVMQLNAEIFRSMKNKADFATMDLAKSLGEPEWCKGFSRRNTHLVAIAPTVSNSKISGVSPGIEPISANYFADKSAKGTFIYKNPQLVKLLQEKGKDLPETWKSINQKKGSVQHLPFLTNDEKRVFLTARELNQFHLVTQAAQRQKFIDQAQSLNLFFPANVNADYFTQVHFKAWELGVKSLYYCRSGSAIDGDIASRQYETECQSCDG